MSEFTLQSYYNHAVQTMCEVYTNDEANAIVNWVFEDLFTIRKPQISFLNRELTLSETDQLNQIVNRLKSYEPIQYVLGYTYFLGHRIRVNKSVLIPRSETEELTTLVIKHIQSNPDTLYNVLDIGTGSGCIPIAIQKACKNARVFAIDISQEAINTANENALHLRADIQFRCADFLNEPEVFKDISFDLLVSNPPYISQKEQNSMEQNVVKFEPHQALFVPDDDALIFYRHIAEFAQRNLAPNGQLFLEINQQLGKETVSLLLELGLKHVELIKDINNNDRFIMARNALM